VLPPEGLPVVPTGPSCHWPEPLVILDGTPPSQCASIRRGVNAVGRGPPAAAQTGSEGSQTRRVRATPAGKDRGVRERVPPANVWYAGMKAARPKMRALLRSPELGVARCTRSDANLIAWRLICRAYCRPRRSSTVAFCPKSRTIEVTLPRLVGRSGASRIAPQPPSWAGITQRTQAEPPQRRGQARKN
jgi:hypothetical protein